jgi:hypothetical protein
MEVPSHQSQGLIHFLGRLVPRRKRSLFQTIVVRD